MPTLVKVRFCPFHFSPGEGNGQPMGPLRNAQKVVLDLISGFKVYSPSNQKGNSA